MGSRLYVGNISWQTTESDLTGHFAKHGTVKSAKIVTDHATGRSKGFGFVEMSSEDEAQEAINFVDGKDLNGRPLRVSVAQDREPRTRRPEGRGFPRREDRGF